MNQHSISKYFKNSRTGDCETDTHRDSCQVDAHSAIGADLANTPTGPKSGPSAIKRTKSTTVTNSKKHKPVVSNHKSLTPLEQQIVRLKLANQDKILAVNVGYKYKFFGSDSRLVSSILNITMVPGKEHFTASLLHEENNISNIENDPEYPNDKFYGKLAYCSIPDSRLSIHLKKLLKYGHKVGIIEQQQDIESETRLVHRQLTKTYTRATYLDDYSLDHPELDSSFLNSNRVFGNNNNVMSILELDHTYSLISVDLITGQIVYDVFKDSSFSRTELDSRIYHLAPTEIVAFDDLSDTVVSKLKLVSDLRIEVLHRDNLDTYYIEKLRDMVHEDLEKENNEFESDDSFLSDFDDSAVLKYSLILEFIDKKFTNDLKICLYNLIKYLKDFNMISMFSRLSNYKSFIKVSRMNLNKSTLVSLDILQNSSTGKVEGSLYDLINHTKTPMGGRLLKEWVMQPLVNRDQIHERLQCIEDIQESKNIMLVEKVSKLVSGLPDLSCILSKVNYGNIGRKDFYLFLKTLVSVLQDVQLVKNEYLGITHIMNHNVKSPLFVGVIESLIRYAQQINLIEEKYLNLINVQVALDSRKLSEDSHLYFNSSSSDYRLIQSHLNKIEYIKEELDNVLSTYKCLLKKPLLKFTKIGSEEYLLEILKSNVNKIPNNFIKFNETKYVIRFRTPQTLKLLNDLKEEKSHLRIISNKCFKKFIANFSSEYHIKITGLISQIAQLDCLFSITAASLTYTKPKFVDSQYLYIHEARHPLVETKMTSRSFIANDINLSEDGISTLILTGANMGGKSTYVRSIALIVIMAQIGCYVPADNAVLGVFDSVFTRMGFNDDIIRGKSTFMVEMEQCLHILKHSTEKSLVIFDELGRGTSTTDGISIAYSVLRYLLESKHETSDNNPLILFITHFIELCSLESEFPKKVKNVHMDYEEIKNHGNDNVGDIIFLYKLISGYCENSFGLNTAKVCLLDRSIIDSAFKISNAQKNKMDHYKSSLNFQGLIKFVDKLVHSEMITPENISEFKQRILELD